MKMLLRIGGVAVLAALLATSIAQAEGEESTKPVVVMQTSLGEIQLELEPEKAPISVENFLKYVNDGYYEGTIFHRVMDGFMVQGGGFTVDMKQKTAKYPPIQIESKNGLKNDKYTVAMARTPDPNSASSQFFINVVDNAGLNYPNPDGYGYAVFGKVIKGQDVVDKIRVVKTTAKGAHQNVPIEPVMILSAKVAGSEAPAAKPAEKTAETPKDGGQ